MKANRNSSEVLLAASRSLTENLYGNKIKAVYRLYPTRKPPAIDIGELSICPMIYELEGDSLKICRHGMATSRPKRFQDFKTDPRVYVDYFERVQARGRPHKLDRKAVPLRVSHQAPAGSMKKYLARFEMLASPGLIR